MKYTIALLLASPALVACTALAEEMNASSPKAQAWKPHSGPPPWDFRFNPAEVYYRNIDGGVWNVAMSSDFPEASVSIDWTYRPTGEYVRQVFPLSYWVSAVALDHDGLGFAVAGKRPNGNTVIDHYRTSPPAPPGSQAAQPQGVAVDSLYDAATEGMDIVSALEYTRVDADDRMLLQFYDSRALFTIDSSNPVDVQLALLAAPTEIDGAAPPFLVHALSDRPLFQIRSMKHLTHGTVFVFESSINGRTTIVATDQSGTGDVTWVGAIENDDWADSDFAEASNLRDW